MTLDYLDPYRPVRPPDAPADRSDEPRRDREPEPVEDQNREDSVRREDRDAYDDYGETVDEYA